jgi:hypothetical protein
MTCVFWVRIFYLMEEYSCRPRAERISIRSFDGRIEFFTSRFSQLGLGYHASRQFVPAESGWMDMADIKLTIPYFSAFVWTTALPFFRWIALRRARPSNGCLCRICGYDIRATPDRCPECGKVPDPFIAPGL